MKKILHSITFICVFMCGNALAATYYVSTTGDDVNTGLGRTDDLAWLTPQHAYDSSSAGDVIIILPGTYNGIYANSVSGTSSAKIYFKAETTGSVIFRRNLTEGADADIIPAGTTWTNLGGNRWRSPTNSVLSNGNGLLKNHDYWFAKTAFSANVTGHGNDPWYYMDTTNHRVEINSTTDPTLDEFVATDSGSFSLHVTGGVSYLEFDGIILEYSGHGFEAGNGNTVGNDAHHITLRNCTLRYNGTRGTLALGEPNAISDYIDFINCTAHTNAEHGFKVGSNTSQTIGLIQYVTYTGCVSYNNGYNGFQVSSSGNHVIVRDSTAYDNGRNPCGQVQSAGEGCASFTANFSNGVADNVTWTNLVAFYTGTRTLFGTDNTTLDLNRNGLSMFTTNNMIMDRINSFSNHGNGFYATTSNSSSYTGDVVKNSVFRDNGNYNIYISGTDNLSFYNNTTDQGTNGEVYFNSGSTGTTFKNNAFIGKTGKPIVHIASPFSDAGVVTIPNSNSYNAIYGSTTYSVEFKGTLTDYLAATHYILDKRNSTPNTGFVFYVKTDRTIGLQIYTGAGLRTTSTTSTVTLGSPAHIVFTWSNTAAPKIYLNGSEASYDASSHQTVTTPSDDTANVLNVGNGLAKTNLWNGSMTKIRIYRGKELSSGEVTTLYGGGTVSGATGEYLFTDGSGTTLSDSSGNANNGTLNSYVSWSGASLVFSNHHDAFSGTMNYNAYYSPDSTPFNYNESSYNFSGFKSASSQDTNSVSSDFRSEFTDYSRNNYSITASSTTLKDAGTNLSSVGVDHDFRILPRPQGSGYSIGAYEEGSGLLIS